MNRTVNNSAISYMLPNVCFRMYYLHVYVFMRNIALFAYLFTSLIVAFEHLYGEDLSEGETVDIFEIGTTWQSTSLEDFNSFIEIRVDTRL